MSDVATYEIRALTPETWPAFDELVIRHNGIFGGCYCIAFHPDGPERGQGKEANRALKCSFVAQGKAHAALVMDGDEAIAWAEYGTPDELPGIHHRKQYDAEKDHDPDYRITCVFVDRRYRRQGLVEVAIRGALDLIAQSGGSVPRDDKRRSALVPPVRASAPRLSTTPRSLKDKGGPRQVTAVPNGP